MKAIELINKRHGTENLKPMTLTLDVEEIAELMEEYASIKCKELEDAIDSLKKELHEANEECDRLSVFIRNNSYPINLDKKK